ncbi:MAG: 16S rRNA (guanine(966)-N(2))-methyltransferase RsmD [Rhodocyclaceae bacterium]|nr:MAG: 16S rRNA (guanine(966)-N(2))-methyltransferase RsmD [Rhodocyclaceae bacterium]
MSRIRITGGEWRSRLIKVADSVRELRPTPDRVRVTLFNWLGRDLTGLSCLDLFAGSGILGFEAASRGAELVTLVEQDQGAYAGLRQNAQALGSLKLELLRADAVKFANSTLRRYDLIFLDPPFRQGWVERMAPLLPRLANPGARLYVEAEHAVETVGPWRSIRQNRAGQVCYQLLEQA